MLRKGYKKKWLLPRFSTTISSSVIRILSLLLRDFLVSEKVPPISENVNSVLEKVTLSLENVTFFQKIKNSALSMRPYVP